LDVPGWMRGVDGELAVVLPDVAVLEPFSKPLAARAGGQQVPVAEVIEWIPLAPLSREPVLDARRRIIDPPHAVAAQVPLLGEEPAAEVALRRVVELRPRRREPVLRPALRLLALADAPQGSSSSSARSRAPRRRRSRSSGPKRSSSAVSLRRAPWRS